MIRVAGARDPWRGHLDLASLVVTRAGACPSLRLPPEQARILLRCRRPLSVAEITTELRLPLDTVRALLGILSQAGLIDVLELPSQVGRPSRELLQKLLAALHAL
ncbi:DUF742 domain-containing protein [Micromonospora sp. KC723]|uniref:DUF742 domain-containing protein n=1 Tax=Micromonospora sp. KC723 TaxID=2530381 RepID=UPI001A9CE9A0|nr:DUF742 domain-containing protein [Micromonospora sp. KC723]